MAQGTVTCFEEFALYSSDGSHDLNTDGFKVALLSVAPTGADATPDYADYTVNEVSGGGYTAGGEVASVTWTEAGGVATFALSTPIVWSKNGTGPTNIKYALLYNTTHAGTNDAIAFVDLTADGGTTPISLQAGDITINAGTFFNKTV